MNLDRPVQIGVDYYPEQWDPALWEPDAKLMYESGVRVVRIAEFAWSRMEPYEGHYEWEWLDEAIQTLHRNGLEVVIGTPTATPPRWLTEKYPDILPVLPNGQQQHAGVRMHRCFNSPSMLAYSVKIVEKLAERYATHPAIIGWQTDNEFGFTNCQCEACATQFRDWVRRKYTTLERVNQEWGTVVWSGEYNAWSQIGPPYGGSPHQNPSYLLDYSRFQTDSIVTFQKQQIDILRAACPNHFITHNFWSYPQRLEEHKVAQDLDFASFDYYPNTSPGKMDTASYSGALSLDVTRGIKQRNFWIMEQLSGPPGCWFPMWRTPSPGYIRAHSWQAIARGADAVVHFRWRSATHGAEQFWHGLIDHSNVPGRRFAEFVQLCDEVNRLGERLRGTELQHHVAILKSADQLNALSIQPQSPGFDYYENIKQWHRALTKLGIGVDVAHPTANLNAYKIVIAPHLYLLDQETADRLQAFAAAGGTLVLTNRSGVKNDNNVCVMAPLPGLLADCAGVRVTEYDPIGEDLHLLADEAGQTFQSTQWCDVLELTTASAIATYADDFYAGSPAITVNCWEKGQVYYLGTQPEDAYLERFLAGLAADCNLPALDNLPSGVQITTRTGASGTFQFILNLNAQPVSVALEAAYVSAIDGQLKEQVIHLPPYELEILEISTP